MKKRRILLTGASGFIGKNLCAFLQSKYTLFTPSSDELDLTDDQSVKAYLSKHVFDEILHCAVYHVTRNSTRSPEDNLRNNLRMFFNLARCNNLYGRMFYFGSGAEFGKQTPIIHAKEDDFDTVVPQDDYGLFKYIQTMSLGNFTNIYNLRLFGVFGPHEDWEIRFISNAICRVISGMDISISQNVRFDYIYVKDVCRIVKLILDSSEFTQKTMNICTGKSIDLRTLAEIIIQVSQKRVGIHVEKPGYKNEYSGSNDLLMRYFPKFQFTSYKESIRQLYAWYEKNKAIIIKSRLEIDTNQA